MQAAPSGRLWLKELESYNQFPPMQDPESYNLTQVMDLIKAGTGHPSGLASTGWV